MHPSENEDFWDTKTGMITRGDYFKNKIPLWEKSQSGQNTDSRGADPTV